MKIMMTEKGRKRKRQTNSPATLCITVIAIVIHVSGSKMSYVNKVAHFCFRIHIYIKYGL